MYGLNPSYGSSVMPSFNPSLSSMAGNPDFAAILNQAMTGIPDQVDKKNPRPNLPENFQDYKITVEQEAALTDILSNYDPQNLNEESLQKMHQEIKNAGIYPGKDLALAMLNAGFNLPHLPLPQKSEQKDNSDVQNAQLLQMLKQQLMNKATMLQSGSYGGYGGLGGYGYGIGNNSFMSSFGSFGNFDNYNIFNSYDNSDEYGPDAYQGAGLNSMWAML